MNLTIQGILYAIPGVIIAVTLHEYTKSLVAYKLGDTGIREQRRLAPNPRKHVDLLGMIFLVVFRYGWSSPVRLTPASYKDRRMAMLFIFIMPFLVNFITGVAIIIGTELIELNAAYLAGSISIDMLNHIVSVLYFVGFYNVSFALFSIIPVHPFTGNHLLWAANPSWAAKVLQHEGFIKLAIVFFIAMGFANQLVTPLILQIINALTF